jgi:hypothetical protein
MAATREKSPDSTTKSVLIQCDHRADLRNGKIGMVLESPGSSLELRALYGKSVSITMVTNEEGTGVHRVSSVDSVYVKLASLGGVFVFKKDGTVLQINKMRPDRPITGTRVHPEELEAVSLTVGKVLPGLYVGSSGDPITSIVAVSSTTYTPDQIERRTKGKTVPFVLEADRLMKNESDWSGS